MKLPEGTTSRNILLWFTSLPQPWPCLLNFKWKFLQDLFSRSSVVSSNLPSCSCTMLSNLVGMHLSWNPLFHYNRRNMSLGLWFLRTMETNKKKNMYIYSTQFSQALNSEFSSNFIIPYTCFFLLTLLWTCFYTTNTLEKYVLWNSKTIDTNKLLLQSFTSVKLLFLKIFLFRYS